MSRYIQAWCPFKEDYDDPKAADNTLVSDWAEAFFDLLAAQKDAPFSISQLKHHEETQLINALHAESTRRIVALSREHIESEDNLSWGTLQNIFQDEYALQAISTICGASENNDAALFSIINLHSTIQDAFIETHMVQRGKSFDLLNHIIPSKAANNASNLLEQHAESVLQVRQIDLSLLQNSQTNIVQEANVISRELYYHLAVGQAFSQEGNKSYDRGGALVGPPPTVSEHISTIVQNTYHAVRGINTPIGKDLILQPTKLLETFRQLLAKNLDPAEKSAYDQFYNSSLAPVLYAMDFLKDRSA